MKIIRTKTLLINFDFGIYSIRVISNFQAQNIKTISFQKYGKRSQEKLHFAYKSLKKRKLYQKVVKMTSESNQTE